MLRKLIGDKLQEIENAKSVMSAVEALPSNLPVHKIIVGQGSADLHTRKIEKVEEVLVGMGMTISWASTGKWFMAYKDGMPTLFVWKKR